MPSEMTDKQLWDGLISTCMEALEDGNEVNREEEDFSIPRFESPLSTSSNLQTLEELISRAAHFPTPEVADFLKAKADACIAEGRRGEAALALLHAQGIYFRHQVRANASFVAFR